MWQRLVLCTVCGPLAAIWGMKEIAPCCWGFWCLHFSADFGDVIWKIFGEIVGHIFVIFLSFKGLISVWYYPIDKSGLGCQIPFHGLFIRSFKEFKQDVKLNHQKAKGTLLKISGQNAEGLVYAMSKRPSCNVQRGCFQWWSQYTF